MRPAESRAGAGEGRGFAGDALRTLGFAEAVVPSDKPDLRVEDLRTCAFSVCRDD
jgi:hypothetical protein